MNLYYYRLRNAYVHFQETLRMRNGTDMRKVYIFFQAPRSLRETTIEHWRLYHTDFGIYRYWESDLHQNVLIYPEMIYGAFPEQFRKTYPNLIPDTIQKIYKISQYFEDNPYTATRFLLLSPMHKRRLL